MRRLALCTLLAAACAQAPAKKPAAAPEAAPAPQESFDFSREGGFENGRLTSPEQSLAGPFVVTFLSPGAELELVSTAAGGGRLGRVAGPLPQPFQVASGAALRLAAQGDVVYAGYRPSRITQKLDAWLGRKILVAVVRSPPEEWSLREIGSDHLTLERSRTYRVVPVRRIAEISWTDLTGSDPRPLLVLAPE